MKLTDLFVKRPVLAIVVNLVILIAGLQSIRSLSVRQYPRSDIAEIQVSTVYVGANADLVRGFITTPLERVIASADGIDYMESSSAQGMSTISVHLKLNYDTNAALTQIQAKVAQVRNTLPPEAEAPVIDLQTADTQFASMYIGFSSTDLNENQITDYLTRAVQPRLSAVSGVQRADILGNRTFAMRIWLKPDKLAALDDVLKTLGETLVIVIIVIFLFLGSVRSVLIPVVAIPISLIGAVFLMAVFGFTINLLTLLAIVLSVGLVVDDAIVMVENVERHLHMGKSPVKAATDAARELVGPIIAMTITLAAVYAPIGIQGGLTGALFREFAFTLSGAVIVSGIVALTLSA